MKYQYLAFAGMAAAAPALDKRQGSKYCFVFARGSTEPSPIGILIGPSLKSSLASKLPGLQTFPVGYDASIGTNISNDRTDAKSKQAGVAAFQKAAGCQVIVAGGYSQGAAVMHNVVGTVNGKKSPLPENIRNKIAAVALFGDTRNKQDSGHIKDFPTERSKVWCNASDGVCGGALNVNAGHLSYSNSQINEAATYLANQAKSFKGGDSGSSGGGGEAPSMGKKKAGKGKTSKPPPVESTPEPAPEPAPEPEKPAKKAKSPKAAAPPKEAAPEPAAAEAPAAEAPAAEAPAAEAPAAEAPAAEAPAADAPIADAPAAEAPAEAPSEAAAPKAAKKGKSAKSSSMEGHSHGSKWVNVPASSPEDTPLTVDESVANVVLDQGMLEDGSVYAGVSEIS